MLNFFRKMFRPQPAAPFWAPIECEGLVYAVGDIHGRHDLLARLIDQISEDAAEYGATPQIVFLGDYVDRSEGARETLDLLIALAAAPDAKAVFLMGNHEQMLLRFLHDPASGSTWLRRGGLQTLLSYGVGAVGDLRNAKDAARVAADLTKALGPHRGFIERLQLTHRTGNVLFVHAGADPTLSPDEQSVSTLLWGSARFHRRDRTDGLWVVHGHFVVDEPYARGGRVAVDTGAYFSGRLTAARIADGEVRFFEA